MIIWIALAALVLLMVLFTLRENRSEKPDFSALPQQFVVFDLETTGLKPETCEIIEIGAIRVNRDSTEHDTFQALITPAKKIPKKITSLTGITQKMIDTDGESLAEVLPEFLDFIGDLRLVTFNAEFDMAFLRASIGKHADNQEIQNPVSCALKMARRAWPDRKGYKLLDLAKDGNLSTKDGHRALGDCQRTLTVYTTAASILRSAS